MIWEQMGKQMRKQIEESIEESNKNYRVYIGTYWKDDSDYAFQVIGVFERGELKIVVFKAIGELVKDFEITKRKNVFVRTQENFLVEFDEIR